MAARQLGRGQQNVAAKNAKIYANDQRRTNVRRELDNTLEKELKEVSALQPLTTEDYKRNIKRVRTIANRKRDKQVQGNRHHQAESSSFPNRVISYFGDQKSSPEADVDLVGRKVEAFVQLVLVNVAREDKRFNGNLVPCGSYYEGVKVKHPNEFDYIWELNQSSFLSCENLEFFHVRPETFKPRKQDDVYGRTYFKLEFKDNVPKNWQCMKCQRAHLSTCSHNKALIPRDIQEDFRRAVEKVATKLLENGGKALVTASGPAVTLFTQLDSEKAGDIITPYGRSKLKKHKIPFFLIKIDMTLAIPLKKRAKDNRWPFQDNAPLELDEAVSPNCHVVAAGDFWRLSFSKIETELMKKLTHDSNRKHCFRALKCIRDELSLTSDHETGLLATYPLKVTFLKENKVFSEEKDWDSNTLATRTKNILKIVEKDGEDGKLTSYFVKNDPVLLESDRSYLESRRIQQYLEKIAHQYRINGYVHMSLLIALIMAQIMLLITSIVFVKKVNGFNIDDYVLAVLPLSIMAFIFSLFGLLWITIQKWCLYSTNILYDMNIGILFVYVGFTLVCVVETALSLTLSIIFGAGIVVGETVMKNIAIAITIISAAVLAFTIIHSAFFIVFANKNLKYFSWEIIFFDSVYKHVANACIAKLRKTKIESPNRPPRVNSDVNSLDSRLAGPFYNHAYDEVDDDVEAVYEDTTDPLPQPKMQQEIPKPRIHQQVPKMSAVAIANGSFDESAFEKPPPLPNKKNVKKRQDAFLDPDEILYEDTSETIVPNPTFVPEQFVAAGGGIQQGGNTETKGHQLSNLGKNEYRHQQNKDPPPPIPPKPRHSTQQHNMENQLYFSTA